MTIAKEFKFKKKNLYLEAKEDVKVLYKYVDQLINESSIRQELIDKGEFSFTMNNIIAHLNNYDINKMNFIFFKMQEIIWNQETSIFHCSAYYHTHFAKEGLSLMLIDFSLTSSGQRNFKCFIKVKD